MTIPSRQDGSEASEFDRQSRMKPTSWTSDLYHFLRGNKKWWLLPLIVMLLTLGVLMVLATTGVAPFIYTLF